MIRPASLDRDGPPHRLSLSQSLLAQLRKAHGELFLEMSAMDLMTLGGRPSDAVITCARWKISQASLLKRTLVARVIDFLDNRDPSSDGVLKELRSADQQLLRHSAAHIGRWPFQKIGEDWDGYCQASRQIRTLMRSQVLREREQLYPLLGRLS